MTNMVNFNELKFQRTTIIGLVLLVSGLTIGGVGGWLLLRPAEYQATVKIKIEPDMQDAIPGQTSYDPYFVQTTFEILQSELVLSNVITALNLDETWGEKSAGGGKLTWYKTLARLKERMKLEPVRNTTLIAISFTSNDPNEAAKVANAIAKAYLDYRMQTRQQLTANGLAALEQQYQKEETQIEVLRTGTERMHMLLGVPDGEIDPPANPPPGQQPYWSEKRQLDQLTGQHKLLGLKLDAVKVDATISVDSMVRIVDPAVPPAQPIGPNRIWGGRLFLVGFMMAVGGGFLLKLRD